MKFYKFFIPTIIVWTFLSISCANTLGTDFNSSTIYKGMNESEVIKILGKPSKSNRKSKIDEKDVLISVYKYQSPTKDGKYNLKELTIIYSENIVSDLNFRERISLEPVKGARVSNKILDISGAKFDL